MDRKYTIDTEENKQFLKEGADRLWAFGHNFASPGGGSYYLGDDGQPYGATPGHGIDIAGNTPFGTERKICSAIDIV